MSTNEFDNYFDYLIKAVRADDVTVIDDHLSDDGIYNELPVIDMESGLFNNCNLFHCAAWLGSNNIIKELLKRGANVNKGNGHDWTPLHIAARYNHASTVEILLANGADWCMPNAGEPDSDYAPNEYYRIVGPDIGYTIIDKGFFPIHVAAKYNSIKTLKVLIDNCSTVDLICGGELYTPLHVASVYNAVGAARYLIDKGADINKATRGSDLPITLSYHNNSYETWVLILLRLFKMNDPLINATCTQLEPIYKCKRKPILHYAVITQDKYAVYDAINNGSYLEEQDSDGWTPLHHAISVGDYELTYLLLKCGCSPNSVARSLSNEIVRCDISSAEEFDDMHDIMHDPWNDRNYQDGEDDVDNWYYDNPADGIDDNNELVSYETLSQQIDIKASCLHIATMRRWPRIVKLLLMHNADSRVVDAVGMTVYDYARSANMFDVLEILEQYDRNSKYHDTDDQIPDIN